MKELNFEAPIFMLSWTFQTCVCTGKRPTDTLKLGMMRGEEIKEGER